MIRKFRLFFHTVRYMRPLQIACLVLRRVLKFEIKISGIKSYTDVVKLNIISDFPEKRCLSDDKQFDFLNDSVVYDIDNIDWRSSAQSKLWRYNLHYFDYLLSQSLTPDFKSKLIDSWIENNPVGCEDAWEPYTASLRIVNWIKYFSEKGVVVKNSWDESLFNQIKWLEGNLECHILANHYLKNAVALYFASLYFTGDYADSLKSKAITILLMQLNEQFLPDGGHYEKSPMYHSICLEDVIDIVNISDTNKIDPVFLDVCKSVVLKGVLFLKGVLHPDNQISLFNDSAFSIATEPAVLISYASNALNKCLLADYVSSRVQAFYESGLYAIRSEQSFCLIDCGSISPSYQPGHTHCDLLSYELSLQNHRIVVDTGLHDYDSSPERTYCRSTMAHNTVVIDGKEQSELWGQFRVARRAKVISAELVVNNDVTIFNGSYSPYWSYKNEIVHTRKIKQKGNNWVISDSLTGNGEHSVKNYIHLHPDVDCQLGDADVALCVDGIKIASFSYSNNVDVSLFDGWYYPEFGIKKKNTVIVLSYMGSLPMHQQYTFTQL